MLFLKLTLLDDRAILIDAHQIEVILERNPGKGINIKTADAWFEVQETMEHFVQIIETTNGNDAFSSN